jgi:two-component system response regulator
MFQIILIEDNPDDAHMTLRGFRLKNLDKYVIHLKNGEQAIQFFFNRVEFNGHLFSDSVTSIILLDIRMPKVDGIEVLRKLKESDLTKHVPVVILSSSTDDPVIRQCMDLGADDYLVKPVTVEGFKDVVEKLVPYWEEYLGKET